MIYIRYSILDELDLKRTPAAIITAPSAIITAPLLPSTSLTSLSMLQSRALLLKQAGIPFLVGVSHLRYWPVSNLDDVLERTLDLADGVFISGVWMSLSDSWRYVLALYAHDRNVQNGKRDKRLNNMVIEWPRLQGGYSHEVMQKHPVISTTTKISAPVIYLVVKTPLNYLWHRLVSRRVKHFVLDAKDARRFEWKLWLRLSCLRRQWRKRIAVSATI